MGANTAFFRLVSICSRFISGNYRVGVATYQIININSHNTTCISSV